ncbi:uncharacterized protein DNG_02401 [Cephalotrichum gorgonifer]|uniref:Uncharacterized protein n=1 Tax=Cephalotrichum gorgonifer TaxID=2041049 RepID=A0AAE8MT71_9PEZI|nr:uncharacterized protein DNG_02401 [Cephalotrichum gorgonifer]
MGRLSVTQRIWPSRAFWRHDSIQTTNTIEGPVEEEQLGMPRMRSQHEVGQISKFTTAEYSLMGSRGVSQFLVHISKSKHPLGKGESPTLGVANIMAASSDVPGGLGNPITPRHSFRCRW